jgi:two-component sensor histidine kinase
MIGHPGQPAATSEDRRQVERSSWQCLSAALRELAKSTSAEQIAEVAGKAAAQLCDADAVVLHRYEAPSCSFVAANPASSREIGASITIGAPGPRQPAALTVDWYEPRAVTDVDYEILEILDQAASLALRALPVDSAPSGAAFHPQERARFFDFQRQVRGLLAIVRSIVRRMAETSRSIDDYAAHLEGRIGALARTQGFLLRAPETSVDLEELVRSEFLAQSIGDEQLQIDGPRILLGAKAAQTLGLALHELTTNSIKFGALVHGRGRVHVLWHRDRPDGGRVVLNWQEHAGHVIAAPVSKGFGFELIEGTLPYELGGSSSIALHPSGLQCLITFAAPPHDFC